MKKTNLILFGLFILLALSISPVEAITNEKEADIRILIVLMGNDDIAEQMSDLMIIGTLAQLKEKYPRMTKEAEHAVSNAIAKVIEKEGNYLVGRLTPLYDRHFTHSEIKELIKFYGSPVGQKFTANFQSLTAESMQIGQEWITELRPKIQESMAKELEGVTIED